MPVGSRAIAIALLLAMGCRWTGEPAGLLSESEAVRHCYDWPGTNWSRNHRARLGTRLNTGDRAVDLTLRRPNGNPMVLSDLLQEKPVLLVSGSATCPRYRDNEPHIASIARQFSDELHVAVVYTMEAHPRSEANPYAGKRRPTEASDRNQATTWKTRSRDARDLNTGQALVLVDDLRGQRSNPFWCTYGPCPNCAFLIAQDGTLAAVHEWLDPPTMVGSIEALIR